MSRQDRAPEPHPGSVRTTAVGTLLLWGTVGLVGGWAVRPVAQRLGESPPTVSWIQVSALFVVAGALAWTAWVTRQTLVNKRWLEPQKAVNRLVLAKACALVGALACGGYAGYVLTWLGNEAALADQRMFRSGVGAVAGLLMVLAALLLEWACRVSADDEDPGGASDRSAEPDPA